MYYILVYFVIKIHLNEPYITFCIQTEKELSSTE